MPSVLHLLQRCLGAGHLGKRAAGPVIDISSSHAALAAAADRM
jgi:hypothetical protein